MADIDQVQWNIDNDTANFCALQSLLALTQINRPKNISHTYIWDMKE